MTDGAKQRGGPGILRLIKTDLCSTERTARAITRDPVASSTGFGMARKGSGGSTATVSDDDARSTGTTAKSSAMSPRLDARTSGEDEDEGDEKIDAPPLLSVGCCREERADAASTSQRMTVSMEKRKRSFSRVRWIKRDPESSARLLSDRAAANTHRETTQRLFLLCVKIRHCSAHASFTGNRLPRPAVMASYTTQFNVVKTYTIYRPCMSLPSRPALPHIFSPHRLLMIKRSEQEFTVQKTVGFTYDSSTSARCDE